MRTRYNGRGRKHGPHRRKPNKRARKQHRAAVPRRTAFRQRGNITVEKSETFGAPEDWHEPRGDGKLRFVAQSAGEGYVHPVTEDEVRERIAELPERYRRGVETIQFSRMTKKRALFPCYGMQWGPNVYLYPIEDTYVETYVRPPLPEQVVEARMFGATWNRDGDLWRLEWTPATIRDFYLNNVLIHEIGHVHDDRNSGYVDRERFAEWFAIEYGYRASRGRR